MTASTCNDLISFMETNRLDHLDIIDTPDGINHDPGIYFDYEGECVFPEGDEGDDMADDLVGYTFEALGVLHKQHPYKRLDGTFYLKEGQLNFVETYSCY
jgi:hypothetical protein